MLVYSKRPIVREGILSLLANEEYLRVVGRTAEGDEILRLVREVQPDILLLDVDGPGPPLLAVVTALREAGPKTKALALVDDCQNSCLPELMKAGLFGCLVTEESGERLVAAIRGVARGEPQFSDAVVAALFQKIVEAPTTELTPRQKEVLQLAAEGLTNREIGLKLGIEVRTVRDHNKNARERLGAVNRTEAVVRAMQRGLIAGPK